MDKKSAKNQQKHSVKASWLMAWNWQPTVVYILWFANCMLPLPRHQFHKCTSHVCALRAGFQAMTKAHHLVTFITKQETQCKRSLGSNRWHYGYTEGKRKCQWKEMRLHETCRRSGKEEVCCWPSPAETPDSLTLGATNIKKLFCAGKNSFMGVSPLSRSWFLDLGTVWDQKIFCYEALCCALQEVNQHPRLHPVRYQ